MTLYEIIRLLQTTQGTNNKLAILQANKDNELLQAYLKAVYNPSVNYYQKKTPKLSDSLPSKFVFDYDILEELEKLSERTYTGSVAKAHLVSLFMSLSEQGQELLSYIIQRDIRAGIAEAQILKVWPELFFVPPYQRCSLLDDKARKRFEKLEEFLIQPKLDASFAYFISEPDSSRMLTRNGSVYPSWFTDMFELVSTSCVVAGELETYTKDGMLLSRKEGNGILSSILSGAVNGEFENYSFKLTCWDCIPLNDWKQGGCDKPYSERLAKLNKMCFFSIGINIIPTYAVESLQEAMQIYSEYTKQNLEGAVIKDPSSLWKHGTANDIVKLKIKFSADYVITGAYEGEGKYKGMLGGISFATSDNLLQCNVGTGFNDKQRKELWEQRESLAGKVVEIEANDIVEDKQRKDIKSLFLPVFVEIRNDKNEADSMKRVEEQLQAAKEGKVK